MSADKPTSSSSATTDGKSLHPVYSVNNIQTKIPTLDGTSVTYSAWVKLFTLHAKGYKVLNHIDGTDPPQPAHENYDSWAEIDAIVLQWIYGTISKPYLARVLDTNASAQQVWNKLKNVFLSNKKTRAAALEKKFTNLTLSACSSLEDYCQKLQDLAEQLNDVGHVVDESRLVVQLVNGLPKEFDACATVINQNDTSWDDAREAIDLEKQRQDARAEITQSAMVTQGNNQGSNNNNRPPTGTGSNNNNPPNQSQNPNYLGRNYIPGYRGRGRGRRGAQGYARGGGRGYSQQQYGPYPNFGPNQWPTPPPCPHPAQNMWPTQWPAQSQQQQNWHQPSGFGNTSPFNQSQAQSPSQAQGQAQMAYAPPGFTPPQYVNPMNPQELGQALQAMNFQNDPWFMDSGASSHLTADPGPRDGKANL